MGNVSARRDGGFAGDYVNAMWMMLQADSPQDYVIATGISHSVEYLLQTAFSYVNLDFKDYVRVDSSLLRRFAFRKHAGVLTPRRYRWNPSEARPFQLPIASA